MSSQPIEFLVSRVPEILEYQLFERLQSATFSSHEKIFRDASSLQKEPALIADFLAEQTLFGASQVLIIANFSDKHLKALTSNSYDVFDDQESSNHVIITSSTLKKTSKSAQQIKAHPHCTITFFYEPQLSNRHSKQIAAILDRVQLPEEQRNLLRETLERQNPRDIASTLEKLFLYFQTSEPTDEFWALVRRDSDDDVANLIASLFSASSSRHGGAANTPLQDPRDPAEILPTLLFNLVQLESALQTKGAPPWNLRDKLRSVDLAERRREKAIERGIRRLSREESDLRKSSTLAETKFERALIEIMRSR